MMKKLFFFSFLLIFVSHIFSAPIYNYPITLTQPDGTTIDCFASGDEFYNWVHDSEGYTMIRNAQTGWIEYAQVINDQVVTTGRRVGSIDPVTLGVEKWCRISEEQYLQKRDDFMRTMSPSERLAEALTTRFNYRTGVLHNIVIYIRFANETEFTRQKSTVEVLFNGTERGSSLNRYYQDISNNQFSIPSAFFPVNSGSTILSYQDSYPRAYYQPYNATTNPEGYHEDTNEERDREHALLRGAATALKSQIEAAFTADELDYNNDGHVDNICFMIKGDAGAWSSLLWPHRWSLYSGTALYFHGNKRVYDYNFLLEGHLFSASNGRQSVLVHETYHTLGAPDLYRYPSGSFDPVGKWDVMCSNTVPPQSSSAYISNKYGKFVDNLPEITAAGTYTLYPIWDRTQGHNIAYKIASPNSSLEYFVLEYRNKNSEIYESNIPGDGIIIYRVRPSVNGNSNGPPDEVYVFRPGASNNTTAGTIANAFFSSNSGRTVFNDSSNPPCFLSNNSPGGINISNISASGSATMTFTVNYNSYVINAAAEMGGTISPSGIINVTPGENITFTITPDAGYTIGQVLIDGINNLNAVTSGSFTFTNVQSTHSISATFTIPAATIPFTENFETSSSWMFANGTQTNRWVISTAPNAQTVGSTKSLYITNDNATPPTYYYTNTEGSSAATSYVFAYKPIHFETQSSYLLHFQWKANGESYYDLLRCFLVPNSVPIVGGDPYGMTANNNETPSGWIDLSDGILNLTTSFQELSKTFTVNTPDIYNLVFFWKNDYSVGGQPPAAIDNISIIDPSILPPIITTTTLPNTTVASSFNQTLTATGTAPLTWSVESGSLPTGLTLSSVGVISGTPSTAGTFNFTVKVTNAVGNDTKAFAIIVAKADQVIVFQTLAPANQFYSPTFSYTNTASGGAGTGAITYASTGSTATVTVNTATGEITNITAIGTVTVTATKAADANYNTATASYTVTIVKAAQTITWTQTLTATVGDAPIMLTATASSGLAVSYTSETPAVATVSGNTLTIIAVGTSVITAAQAGNAFYNAANNVANILNVSAATYTITLNPDEGTVIPTTLTVTYGLAIGTMPTPNKTGYAFGGWFTGMNGSGTEYTASTIYNISGNTTLYAKWIAIVYDITYILDGGINHPENPNSYTIESPTIYLQNPTKIDYLFDGWMEDSVILSSSIGNKTFTATWKLNIGITEKEVLPLTIYPNPTQKWITIDGVKVNETVTITDLNGRTVLVQTVQNTIVEKTIIDVSLLGKGAYIVRVTNRTSKLIKL